MKKIYLVLSLPALLTCCIGYGNQATAQAKPAKAAKKIAGPYDADSLYQPVPPGRVFFYNRIDKEQRRADYYDGSGDHTIYYGDDTVATRLLTRALLTDADRLQVMIENLAIPDAQTGHQEKTRYLTALYNILHRFNSDLHVDPSGYSKDVANLKQMIIAAHEGKLMDFVQQNVTVSSLHNASLLEGNAAAKAYLYSGLGKKEPRIMIGRLDEFANEPYACDIIKEAAKVMPGEVFNYAYSTNAPLSNAVKRCTDPLVQTIVKIATASKTPRKALPFLGYIYSGRKTIADIDRIASDPDRYFEALVQLKLENEGLGSDTYTDELKYRAIKYVRDMNDLHDKPDAVRFKGIDRFSPEELYFIIVYGVEEIYTSSYTGTFNRMMQRMKGTGGDTLLARVHYDRFRTFIRMCAYYGKLNAFLTTIDEDKKTALMQDFVSGLEKGRDDELEDAVDVADAYSCIEDAKLTAFLRTETDKNYERCKTANAPKGTIVYGLLATIFRGFSDSLVAGNALGLPPVNLCPFGTMQADSSGIVYIQAFYYGDVDGRNVFRSSLAAFPADKWKIESSRYWTTISSKTGKPIVIYANNPLPEPGDQEAQEKLKAYLDEQDIHPSMVIHRGHSYHLPLTIAGLQSQNHIIVLGSCGGYHNLGEVLQRAPDAQIISTRQIGTYRINKLIIQEILQQLQAGKDINWVTTWAAVGKNATQLGSDALMRFKDYVPPHKNLGAIFIKAYRRLAVTVDN